MNFNDDLKDHDPRENVLGNYGASCRVSTLENIKVGDYGAWLDGYFPPHFYNPDRADLLDRNKVQQYLNHQDHPLKIQVE